MLLPTTAAPLLAQVFSKLLGAASPGAMAFARCLPPETLRPLMDDKRFAVPGWKVAAVGAEHAPAARRITADVAVEWREDKREAVLLLVDPVTSGAGMDGIYSAAREVAERELFDAACDLARRHVDRGYKGFVQKALQRARRAARYHTLPAWREFTYLARSAESPLACGGALPDIGLWPVDCADVPDDDDLDRAARVVERLLPMRGTALSAEARVKGLKLPDDQSELGERLARGLREVDRLPRFEALARIESEPSLWLNRLRPGVFSEQTLERMAWVPWRGKTGKLTARSGLVDEDERAVLKLRLDAADNPKERARLEVRWATEPVSLPKGTVEYAVDIMAGSDMLASKNVTHSGKPQEKCVFSQGDFGNLDEQARFETRVVIRALSGDVQPCEGEEFLLCYGEPAGRGVKNAAGSVYPTLALAAIQVAADVTDWERLARDPKNPQWFERDAKGHIVCRGSHRSARVYSPRLIEKLAADWVKQGGKPGRWRLTVRVDGSEAAPPVEFVPVVVETGSSQERFMRAGRAYADMLSGSQGPLGLLYGDASWVSDYVNAAMAWWDDAPPHAALIHTVELMDLGGRSLGLIVLPTHPLRVAWQQGFDLLVMHNRYQEGMPAIKLSKLLEGKASTHCPAFLPGMAPGETLVFADNLGFHAAAMVRTNDPEPKATVALMARLLGSEDSLAPSVGRGAAALLADEIGRYLKLHPASRRVGVHALRAGDGLTVTRALGVALQDLEPADEDPAEPTFTAPSLAFNLEFFGAGDRPEWSGRFLAATAEKQRAGAGSVPAEDRWILGSVTRPGGVSLPRLHWARRTASSPSTPAHVAVLFDVFPTAVETRPAPGMLQRGVLEVHGLYQSPVREFSTDSDPTWTVYLPVDFDGEKHPVARSVTERLMRAAGMVQTMTARQLGGTKADWPVLVTRVSPDLANLFERLHKLCDWIITADRHGGVEYFDSPHGLPGVYDAYLIDCVPERDDLGFLQLITSTACLEEVVSLFDQALGEMGLSSSPTNCRFLLNCLKSISGRLALRLAGAGTVVQEMIALALTQSHCVKTSDVTVWPSLTEGFFVPIDDVPELLRLGSAAQEDGRQANLLYVTAAKRGGLQLAFCEVKFRRSLRTARAPDLSTAAQQQLDASCRSWDQLYGAGVSPLDRTIGRAFVGRILRFYARKARRHDLSEDAYERIAREIEKMVRDGAAYSMPLLSEQADARTAFVFCPEYLGRKPDAIHHAGSAKIWLFGPHNLPEAAGDDRSPVVPSGLVQPEPATGTEVIEASVEATHSAPHAQPGASHEPVPQTGSSTAVVQLGISKPGGDPVAWSVSIKANPHLLIVGLPGMGKTTCLIGVCEQLVAQGIAPIVFSYHEDIDEKLAERLPGGLETVTYAGLGFNPMEVSKESPLAYVDNVAMLRDVFAAIFPVLGDVQLGSVREALKRSYQDRGWSSERRGEIPAFGDFLAILKQQPKPDKALMNRLTELDDYGFFDVSVGLPSLLDSARPALVQIHSSQNEVLQRAFATFVLYNLYQTMFRRGPQQRITHAIVFDEAHRAAKLKLIPTMAKECRKYGLSLVLASQEVKDFDASLYAAVASYLSLRLQEADARLMAKIIAPSEKVLLFADRIKQMPKYHAMFYGEGLAVPVMTVLTE